MTKFTRHILAAAAFILGGLVMILAGLNATPEHMPATWANMFTPGPLAFYAGCVLLLIGKVCHWTAE